MPKVKSKKDVTPKVKLKKDGTPKIQPRPPVGHPPYEGSGRSVKWTQEKIEEVAEYFLEFIEDSSCLYYKEFAYWLRVNHNLFFNKAYFTDFSNRSERFKEIHEYAQILQEARIVKGGLIKKLDSQMSKFMLCAVHGYSDKQIISHEGNEVVNVIHYGKKDPKKWKEEKK